MPTRRACSTPRFIVETIHAAEPRYLRCHDERAKRDPTVRGAVLVKLLVGADGAVMAALDGGSKLPDPNVVSCVVATLSSLHFPAPRGGTAILTASLPLSPRSRAGR
ncbi:MAG TPA: AgmX/PglI C-terminal domain-containing protein [Minicystis sp.]|nr:AgmX/PglI C-terminal domain-containing protein [Minicystis sp.]